LDFCEAFAHKQLLLHFQEYMDKKEGEESFFVGALKVLVFDTM
jgi:hypothetical protein